MRHRTLLFVALALAIVSSDARSSTSLRDFGPLGNAASIEGIVSVSDETHVVLTDSSSGPVLLRVGPGNTLVRAVHAGRAHPSSLATARSGFVLAGGGVSDTPWVVKLNDDLQPEWAEEFETDFRPEAVCTTDDGSIYLGGYQLSNSDKTAAVMKLASDGSILWRRTLHGSGDADDIDALQPTKDGVVAAGSTTCGASLWKVLSGGTFAWQRCFSSGAVARFTAVTAADDDGFVAVGYDDASLIIVKTNSAGLFRWKTSAAGPRLAKATDVVQSNHQIVVVGNSATDSFSASLVVAAFTFDGKLAWQRSYGSRIESSGIAFSSAFSRRNAAPDREGGILVGVGIGKSVRLLRFRRDGSLDDDCAVPADNILTFRGSAPMGQATAIETHPFESTAHRVQTAADTAAVQSTPVCSTPSTEAVKSERKVDSDQKRDLSAAYQQVADLLIAKKFSDLDGLADEWRRTRARLDPLYPKMLILYDSVAGQTVSSQVGKDAQEKLLKEWVAARPSSSTAVLALGRYYSTQAFAQRGNSLTVTDKASDEYERLNGAALKVLSEHQKLAEADPQYYAILISATTDGSRYFQAGAAQSDVDVIGDAAVFLLPQWGGTVQQYKQLMEIAVAKTKNDVGETMYARIAWRLIRYACCDDKTKLSETYGLDWARIKQGFLDWSAHSPYSTPLHRLAILAYARKDRATLAEILNRPDVKWDDVAQAEWGSRSGFEEARSWAFPKVSNLAQPAPSRTSEQAAGAVTPIGPHTWPQVLLDSDVTLTNGEHRRFWAFLVHTPNGVMAVSSILPFRSLDSVENPIVQARRQIAAWKLMRPMEPKRSVVVSGYITPMTSLSEAVLLAIPTFKDEPLLRPLDVSETPAPLQSQVFVAACPRSEPKCRQRVFEAKVIAMGVGNDSNGNVVMRTFDIIVDGVSEEDLIGAPVLNEEGFAVGVVLGSRGTYRGQKMIHCEDLSFFAGGH